MPIQAKLPSVIKALVNYINQRINICLWLSLSSFLLLYSVPVFPLSEKTVLTSIFLFFCLLVFRLYDDLKQTIHDSGKPNRDYTQPLIGKTLSKITIFSMLILTGWTWLMSPLAGLFLLGFILVNHFLYRVFSNNKTAAGFLPLLKYPFLFFLLQLIIYTTMLEINSVQIFQAFALFFAFAAFECMEDKSFPVPRVYSYPLQVLSFVLISIHNINEYSALVGLVLLVLSLVLNYVQWKFAPYMFFLFILAFKLAIQFLTCKSSL